MKRILSSSAAVFCLLLPLWAQDGGTPASLSINAPDSYVLAARGLQLSVRTLNSRGALLRGQSYEWRVSDPAVATIDDSGVLTGVWPGPVDVTVVEKSSRATAARRFYVYPASVAIDSGNATVEAGKTLKLTAQAKDADGKTMPGVPFQWFSELPGVARVSPEGMITGVSEGRVTVSAVLDMGPAFARFSSFQAIQVLRRASYQLKTLVSSDTLTSGVTSLVPTRVAIDGNSVAGLTSLSNGGQALVLSQNGKLQTLSTSGSTLNGQVIARFTSVSVNSRGDVAVIAESQSEWCEQILAVFPFGAKSPTILDDTTRCSYWNLSPNAIDRQGNLVYRYANTLYYRKAAGSVQTILNVGDHPGVMDTVNGISSWSVTPTGKVLIEAQNSANVSVYLLWDGAKLQKLFAANDSILQYPAQWSRLPVEIAPDDYVVRIGGSYWASLSRLKAGVWSMVAVTGSTFGWVQDGFGGADGNIFFFADSNGKTSLYRNNGTTNEVLGTYANWRELWQLTATGGDSAIAYGTFDGLVPKAIRFSGTSSTMVLGAGQQIEGAVGTAIAQASIPKGINSAGVILRTYGDALLRATPSGVSFLLKPGDALPGNAALSNLGSVVGNRLGDIAFTAQHGSKTGLYSYRGGQVQLIADTDDLLGSFGATAGGFSFSQNEVAMNNAGHIAAVGYSSGTGVSLFSGPGSAATAKLVMRNGSIIPGTASTFSGAFQVAIDENDRVAFLSGTSAGRTGLFLWDQGVVRKLFETGDLDPNGRTYQSLQNLQAAGTRFYLKVSVSGLNQQMVVDGTSVKVLAYDGYTTTFGTLMSGTFGAEVSANSRGDVVMPVTTPSGPMLFVRRADGTDAEVAIASTRGPDGEWFLNLYGAGISEQGDIVFSGQTWAGGRVRLSLYRALLSQ